MDCVLTTKNLNVVVVVFMLRVQEKLAEEQRIRKVKKSENHFIIFIVP